MPITELNFTAHIFFKIAPSSFRTKAIKALHKFHSLLSANCHDFFGGGGNTGMPSLFILYGFEFKVIFTLNWPPSKAREPCLHYYLM